VQTCVVHLLRASFRYAARQDWDAMAKALRPVYTAPTEAAAVGDGGFPQANVGVIPHSFLGWVWPSVLAEMCLRP
jgi:hypothetical protein